MEGWALYLALAGFVLAGGLLAASPVMVIMFVYNKQQHKFFALLAEEYHLKKSEAPKGLNMIMRSFPNIQGKYQEKYIHIYAGVSKDSYFVQIGAGRSNFKTPLTILKVKPKQRMFNTFVLKPKKDYKLKKGEIVSIDRFNEFFDLTVEPERLPLANSLLQDRVKGALLAFLAQYKQASCTVVVDKDGFWRSELLYETRTQYRYKRALAMLKILLSISEQTNTIARQ